MQQHMETSCAHARCLHEVLEDRRFLAVALRLRRARAHACAPTDSDLPHLQLRSFLFFSRMPAVRARGASAAALTMSAAASSPSGHLLRTSLTCFLKWDVSVKALAAFSCA